MLTKISGSLLVLAALLPDVSASAFAPSLDQLRQSNRISQVDGGPKLPGPLALAHVYTKYGKQAPPAVAQAASAAIAQDLGAPATLVRRAKTTTTTSKASSTPKTSSTSTKTTTTTSATLQSASVQATDVGTDRAYYVNVTVGSTQMLLNFDTGSSDLWVFSSLLSSSQRGSHKLYTPSGSSQGTFSISYGEGSSP